MFTIYICLLLFIPFTYESELNKAKALQPFTQLYETTESTHRDRFQKTKWGKKVKHHIKKYINE